MFASLSPQQKQMLQMQMQSMALNKMQGMGMGNLFQPKKDEDKK